MINAARISTIILGFVLFSNFVSAQQNQGQPKLSFSAFDITQDGKISQFEFDTGKNKILEDAQGSSVKLENISFADVDANSDNVITEEEFKKVFEVKKKTGSKKGKGRGKGNGRGKRNRY
ncbi:MAG: hypothetical protein ABFR62_11915 [Bacteroidota bacterium]